VQTRDPISEARLFSVKLKRTYLRALNNEKIKEFLRVPAPGEALHLVTNGNYDYFMFVTYLLQLLKAPAIEFYAITWTMHETAILELFRLIDGARLGSKVSILASTHLKNTKTAFAARLIDGLRQRGHRLRFLSSHAKIICLASPPHYLVLEGSANWTKYPGVEQNILTNSKEVYEFHREWMEEQLTA